MENGKLVYDAMALFGASLVLNLLVTPIVRAAAHRFNLVDHPDGRRKTQKKPVPVAGGVAIFLSTATILVGALWVLPDWYERFNEQWLSFCTLFAAALVLMVVGVIDDFWGMRGRYKVLGQVVAAGIIMAGGVMVRSVTILNVPIDFGVLAIPFTLFWLLGAINSLNLIDGMDGLLGSVGLILCLAIGSMAFQSNSPGVSFVAFTLGGALLAFLVFNLPPASIYLGDAGSMLIGLAIGTMAIQASLKGPATVALAFPIALMTIPIFDTSAAILRRRLRGRSVFTTDRGHLHHELLRRGLSIQKALLLVSLLCIIACAGALWGSYQKNDWIAVASVVCVGAILMVSRLFGRAEFLLVKQRIGAVIDQVRHGHQHGRVHQIKVHLQGSANWEELWQELITTAEAMRLKKLILDVNAPGMQEVYHAKWDRVHNDDSEVPGYWRAEIPLTVPGGEGRLDVVGLRDEESVWQKLADLAKVVENIELVIAAMGAAKLPAQPVESVAGSFKPTVGAKLGALGLFLAVVAYAVYR